MAQKKLLVFAIAAGILLLGFLLMFLLDRRAVPSPKETFKIVAIDPNLKPDYLYDDTLHISLIFSQPIDSKTFFYSLTPRIQIKPRVTSEGRQIIFNPDGAWPRGTFTLIVKKETRSLAGEKLDKDYNYQFTVGEDPSGGP